MTWPTKSGWPLRRAVFGHSLTTDPTMIDIRQHGSAFELGQVDWILHRTNCNPWRPRTPPARAYDRGFLQEQLTNPTPSTQPIPALAHRPPRTSSRPDE